ncbi:MAG: hypothetical protein M3032_12025 [Verrucomicrobiota bacterium]|nr:hypothetical protein [Verrucomicrobiota bacterium]
MKSFAADVRLRPSAVSLALAAILALFVFEARARWIAAPVPLKERDQSAYLEYAQSLHETNYAFVGSRNRMPIYPGILALLYRQGMPDEEFLARAQNFNIYLTAAVLLLLFVVYRCYFPAILSLALMAMTAFGVFVTRAAIAQVEIPFYLAFFCLFLALWQLLVRPTLSFAALTGVLAGITFFLKASVLPALALFAIAYAAKANWEKRRPIWREAIPLLVVMLAFLLVVFPYIRTSKRIYGHYFHNVNSTFYFWVDSPEQVHDLRDRGRDREGWPVLPPEEIASPQKYWREHSIGQIAGRLFGGMARLAVRDARAEGYWKYIVLLCGAAVFFAVRRRDELRARLRPFAPQGLFLLLFFACYYALFGWYAKLGPDSRFILTLFLPVTFTAAWAIQRLAPKNNFLAIAVSLCAAADALHRLLK